MSTIQMTARFTIHPGKVDRFKDLAARCTERVRGREPGSLQYDWFMSGDESVCLVREAYRDSDAVLAHAANLGPLLGEFGEVCETEFEVCDNAAPHLVEALSVFSARYFAPL
jgi:quinol monooxygenase YgiN